MYYRSLDRQATWDALLQAGYKYLTLGKTVAWCSDIDPGLHDGERCREIVPSIEPLHVFQPNTHCFPIDSPMLHQLVRSGTIRYIVAALYLKDKK